MFESNIVRFVFVPVYVIMTAFTVYLIWKNSASNDSLKNGGIAIAALLPVFIAVLPYLNIQENNKNYLLNLIYDSSSKRVVMGNSSSPYEHAYISVFTNLPKDFLEAERFNDLMGQRGLDLVEKGVINELLLNFSSNWDYETTKQTTPFGENIYRTPSTQKLKKLNLQQVIALFPHNIIISSPGVLTGEGIALPPQSDINITASEKERVITISTEKGKIIIKITPSSAIVMQKGLDGIIDPDTENINRYYLISYTAKLTFEPKRFELFSPEMQNYERWFDNIAEIFQKMTWEEVKNKNKQQLLDNAVKKILKNGTSSNAVIQSKEESNEPQWKQINIKK